MGGTHRKPRLEDRLRELSGISAVEKPTGRKALVAGEESAGSIRSVEKSLRGVGGDIPWPGPRKETDNGENCCLKVRRRGSNSSFQSEEAHFL